MKISFNWLKEYLADSSKFTYSAEEVAQILTDTGLEVEGITGVQANGLDQLIVGKVLEVSNHPNADRLKLARVDIGEETPLNIVCGAPNIAEGQTVVVAPIGATLHPVKGKPMKIKAVKIRGEASEGMICAEDEIGISDSHEGIIVLKEQAVPGTPVAQYFDQSVTEVFEIGLTPNRSDAMSHQGVAKDLAAYLNHHTKNKYTVILPDVAGFKQDNDDLSISVDVKNTDACPRYSGVTLSGLKVGQSPDWLKEKLNSIGIKPTNNIVDVTNFVLWETGQPLHAFDAEKIKGKKIVVQTLQQDTSFITLDEEKRKLNKDDLMICNSDECMCIAGVYGGMHSGVTEKTRGIFLESAYFDPGYIRRTSQYHGLKTDSASRFEKGADPEMTIYALKRASLLIKELCGGSISSEIIDIYSKKIKPKQVKVDYSYLNTIIGKEIPKKEIKAILQDLDIQIVSEKGGQLTLSVPPYRYDVTRAADIAEEILRIYGYNEVGTGHAIKYNLFNDKYAESFMERGINSSTTKRNAVGAFLSSSGFFETVNVPFFDSAFLANSKESAQNGKQQEPVALLNSVNAHLDILRPGLLFSTLNSISHNLNRSNNDLKFFEFGKVYHKGKSEGESSKESSKHLLNYHENERLLLSMTGTKFGESWSTPSSEVSFYHLKSFVENVLSRMGLEYSTSSFQDQDYLQYGLHFLSENKEVLVNFGEVQSEFLRSFEIDQQVFIADFDWDIINKLTVNRALDFTEIPKVPSIRRDLALLLNKDVTFEDIIDISRKTEKKLLKNVNLFDVYEGEGIAEGQKSYAVSFIFQDEKKTLTDEAVEDVMKRLINGFEKHLKAKIR